MHALAFAYLAPAALGLLILAPSCWVRSGLAITPASRRRERFGAVAILGLGLALASGAGALIL